PRVGDDRAEPVKEVQDLRAANAGKEIFVAAGKAHDFMGEDWAEDYQLIVVEDGPVDSDLHIHLKETIGQSGDFSGFDSANVSERGRIVPCMVEEAHAAKFAVSLFGCDLQAILDRLLAHRRMRAQGDHDIKGFGLL